MLIKGHEVTASSSATPSSDDQLYADQFDFMLSNPPFGVDWKKVQKRAQG